MQGYTGSCPTERESVLECGAAAPLSECLRVVHRRRARRCFRKRQSTGALQDAVALRTNLRSVRTFLTLALQRAQRGEAPEAAFRNISASEVSAFAVEPIGPARIATRSVAGGCCQPEADPPLAEMLDVRPAPAGRPSWRYPSNPARAAKF